MMKKSLILAVIVFSVTAAFAQRRSTGRWSTNPAPKGWNGWTDSGTLNVLSEPVRLIEPPARRSLNPNEYNTDVQLDIKVDGERVTGFLGVNGLADLWASPMKIELGKIEGNTIRFMTTRTVAGREPIYYQWIAEMTDDNAMTLRRANFAGGPGEVGRQLPPGQRPAPAPTTLPPLNKSTFGAASLTLRRVK